MEELERLRKELSLRQSISKPCESRKHEHGRHDGVLCRIRLGRMERFEALRAQGPRRRSSVSALPGVMMT